MIKSAFGLDDGIETHRRGLSDHRLRFPGLQQCSAIKTVAFFPTTRNVCVAYVDMYYIYENACKVRASRQRAPTARGCREVEITPVRPTRLDVLKLFFSFSFSLSPSLSHSLSLFRSRWSPRRGTPYGVTAVRHGRTVYTILRHYFSQPRLE